MSSNDIYTPIEPTYLYIKQHSITGLKYFGKTTQDPYKYNGSGKYWKRHIKKHGEEHIETLWVSKSFIDTSISNIALSLSEIYDIVDSDAWANMKPENGLDGGFTSEQAKKRVVDGTHHFLGKSNPSHKRVEDGSHNFLGGENVRTRVENGTHNFLDSKFQRETQRKRVEDGTHHFIGGEIARETNRKRVEDGTHHFIGGELQRKTAKKRVEEGTHNFQGVNNPIHNRIADGNYNLLGLSKQRVEEGTHNFQGGDLQRTKSNRQIYKDVRRLMESLSIKVPHGTYMKSDGFLEELKCKLENM